MYNQIRYLPDDIRSHIVCEITQNLDQFNLPHIHALERAPHWRYLWDKGLRKLKLRQYLGYGVAIAQQHSASILHSHFGDTGWTDLAIAQRARLKHVVTFYGYDVNALPTQDKRWYQRYQTLFERVDQILCEGPHMAKCIAQLGCPAEKIQVHHLGIAIDQILFQPRTWHSGEPLKVLIAASFTEKKGIPYALEALGQLQHEVPLTITIIGDARNNPENLAEKEKILAMLEKHQLQSCTSLMGYQPHAVMLDTAYHHHIFLAPSVTAYSGDTEGGAPVSLIEMAASGMAILSTTHCDIPEVIQQGKTGLLASERDIAGLVDHLRWLIQHPDLWQEMAIAARTHVEQEFNALFQGPKLADIYRALLN
jgi:colanic acid/amylovoran biosynthesis glycosyltransferase